jgi:phosphate transport system substrate-binding protein
MRRSLLIVLSLLVAISLVLSACAPQATETVAPTQAVAEAPTQAPAATNTAALAEPTAAEPTATTAAMQETSDEGMLSEVDPSDVTGNIISAGSSTVYPLTEAMLNLFEEEGYQGRMTIDSIGSGAGFERFCKTGETDLANASRAIKDSEVESCAAINRTPIEFRVGTDAIAVVVNTENDFVTNLTLEELALVYSNETELWSDVNPAWPAETIKRYAPGTDSGTYDFFIEEILLEKYGDDEEQAKTAFQNAKNLQQSEDDNVLVQGVEGDRYSIGFFGFAYYKEQESRLNAVSLDGVTPNTQTAEDGSYALARPLFIYSDATIMKDKPQVASFISFYLMRVNEVIEDVGYFPASDEALNSARQAWLDAMK